MVRSAVRRNGTGVLRRMQKLLHLILVLFCFLPTAQAEERTGTLSVTSTVEGAIVWVNNREVGKTPYLGVLPVGTHSLRVAARYYDPWVSRIQIREGQKTKKEVELFEGGGTVEFIVTPRRAEVVIDGKPAGLAPIRLTDLPPGEHRYIISAEVHEGTTGTFRFQQGDNLVIVEDLEPSAGKWEVRSTPEGAEVYIDDELAGTTPLSLRGISSDVHRVRVSKAGYGTVFREVDTSSGGRGELTVNLPQSSGRLRVNTRSETAVVRVNGNLIGSGKKVSLPIQRGVYTLRVEEEGFKAAEARLNMPRGGTILYKARLVDESNSANSVLALSTPLTSSWVFWSTVGGIGAGAGIATAVVVIGNQPEPPPDGDVKVTLP